MSLRFYVFSSTNMRNIRIGAEHGLWAIPIPKTIKIEQQFKTKAYDMPVGSHGFFYCSDDQCITMPFIVASAPEEALGSFTWITPAPNL